jgi:hypothetical protein
MHLLLTRLFAFGSSTFSGCAGWKGLGDTPARHPAVIACVTNHPFRSPGKLRPAGPP